MFARTAGRATTALGWACLTLSGCGPAREPAARPAKIATRPADTPFVDVESESPDDVRAELTRFATEIGAESDETLDEPGAPFESRREAAEAKLAAWARVVPFDPQAVGVVNRAADRIDAKPHNADLKPTTAYYRVRAAAEDITPEVMKGLEPDPFDRLLGAVEALERAEPTHPEAEAIILQVAREAERRGLDDRAQALFERYAARFPDGDEAPFAAGAARRIAAKGQVLAGIEGPGTDGKPIRLEDLRGKVVLVDFGASWSDEWRAEVPSLLALRARLGPSAFEILGVNLGEPPAEVAAFAQSEGLPWPQIAPGPAAPGGPWGTPLGLRFGVSKLPFRLLVDRRGTLLAVGGELLDLEPAIDAAVAGRAP